MLNKQAIQDKEFAISKHKCEQQKGIVSYRLSKTQYITKQLDLTKIFLEEAWTRIRQLECEHDHAQGLASRLQCEKQRADDQSTALRVEAESKCTDLRSHLASV